MGLHVLGRTQWVRAPLEETFAFYADPRNLGRITPAWLSFQLVATEPATSRAGATVGAGQASTEAAALDVDMHVGLRLHYRIRPLGFPQRWTSEITAWQPPHRFVDEQLRGPYGRWYHEHRFAAERGGTRIEDRVEYALPLGPLGELAHLLLVRKQLKSIFDHRERVIAEIFGGETS